MNNEPSIKAFSVGIVISSLIAIPLLLDISLVPRYLTLAVCICCSFYYLFKSGFTKTLNMDIVLLSYSGYSLICVLSTFWSNTPSEALFESSKIVMGFFVFLFTYFSLKKEQANFLHSLLRISVALFVIGFLIAIYQLSELPDLKKESIYEVSALHGHKNLFSSFLFLNLFFLLLAAYKLENPWKNTARICIFLSACILFLLKTKAVWMGLGAVVVITLVFYVFHAKAKGSKPRIRLAVFLSTALLVLTVFFFYFLQPIIHKSIHYTSNIESPSAGKENSALKLEEERLILWDKTYHLIKQKPILGVGMGNWQIHLPDATLSDLWRGEDLNFTFQRPHNDFLWILSETGFVGFSFFLLLVCSILFLLVQTLRLIPEDKYLLFEILLCLAFIVGYFTISFFDFPRERMEHCIWINIILGISYFHIRAYHPLKNYRNITIGRAHTFLVFIIMIAVVVTGLMRLKGEFFTRKMLNYKNSGQPLKVITAGNSALSFAYSIDPTSVPLNWYTGNANASLGKYDEAQKDFLKALKYNPYNRNVLNDLASSYVFNNNVIMAKHYYEEAARISPRFDEPKLNLAAMYINAKDFKTANTWLQSILHDSERRSKYQKIVDLNK